MPPTRPRAADDRGQATIEHVAIALLIAAVMAAAVLVADRASARAGIAGSVTRQMARALCLVDGDRLACNADRAVCVVGSRESGARGELTVVSVHIERGGVLVKEVRSDGTVAMTVLDEGAAGFSASAGGEAHIGRRGKDADQEDDDGGIQAGAEARAEALVRAGIGNTWVFDDEPAADRWAGNWKTMAARVVGWGASALVGPDAPEKVMLSGGLDVTLGASGDAAGVAGADVSVRAADTYGVTLGRDGTRTLYLRRHQDFHGSLSVAEETLVEGRHAPTEEYALKVGQDGRPRELVVVTMDSFAASRDLPDVVQRAVGYVGTGGPRRRYVLERHLSLTSPRNRQLAAGFIDRLTHPWPKLGAIVDVSAQLRAALDAEGVGQVRTYDDDDRSFDAGASGGQVVKISVHGERVDKRSRLVGAAALGPDGEWYRRGGCEMAAARA